jgi:hypothetical protein
MKKELFERAHVDLYQKDFRMFIFDSKSFRPLWATFQEPRGKHFLQIKLQRVKRCSNLY